MATASSAVQISCQWIARLATASLAGYWIALRGGVLLGVFPALTALMALSRRWMSGQVERSTWAELQHLARRDFRAANIAGWSVAGPVLLLALGLRLGGGSLAACATVLAMGLAPMAVALASAAWIATTSAATAYTPWLLFFAAPHRGLAGAFALTAAAGLVLIHPLLAIYFAPALGGLMAAAVLLPLLNSPVLALDPRNPAPIPQRTLS